MTQYKTREIESSLTGKGFKLNFGSKHKMLTLYVDNKKTSVFTFLSHGMKTYDDSLLSKMKKQLKLEKKDELCDLIDCPMTKEKYIDLLVSRGIVQRSLTLREPRYK
jgi:hypothetical protein